MIQSLNPTIRPICRLCNAPTDHLFSQRVLYKHDVSYYQCGVCDLIQSEEPYWLADAYSAAMSTFDTGAIARNLLCAQLAGVIARLVGITPDSRCADFGGGHGVFVRMMRDKGLDYRLCDKYAQNVFARGFEANPEMKFHLLSSFEVFEHFPNPAADLEGVFSPGHDFVLAGTVLHRGHREGWWYYGPQGGQHVAFYSRATMHYIGERFGYEALPSPAYTLFVRRGVQLAKWRRRSVANLLRNTRPDRNAKWIVALDALMPKHPTLTATDLKRLSTERTAGNICSGTRSSSPPSAAA